MNDNSLNLRLIHKVNLRYKRIVILFVIFDILLLLSSVIFAVFGMDQSFAGENRHSSLPLMGFLSVLFFIFFVVFSVCTFFIFIKYKNR